MVTEYFDFEDVVEEPFVQVNLLYVPIDALDEEELLLVQTAQQSGSEFFVDSFQTDSHPDEKEQLLMKNVLAKGTESPRLLPGNLCRGKCRVRVGRNY